MLRIRHLVPAVMTLAAVAAVIVSGPQPAVARGAHGGGVVAPAPYHFPWETDYRRACARAQAEGKDLLINFTGSDWCGYCIALEQEVFHSATFARDAGRYFVFLKLDFPQDPALQARVPHKEMRDKLQRDLQVEGFPTVWLTTARGTPYAQAGYQAGGPELYLPLLLELRRQGQHVKPLLRAGRNASVPTIRAALPTLMEAGLLEFPHYAWVLQRMRAVDPKGQHGLRQHADRVDELGRMMALFRAGPDWPKVVAFLESARYIRNEHKYASALALTAERYLLSEGRLREAKAFVQRAQNTPSLQGNSWAQQEFQRVLDKILVAEATAAGSAPTGGG